MTVRECEISLPLKSNGSTKPAAAPAPSRAALGIALEAGAWCGWLSGSGPTIATLCSHTVADAVVAALPPEGRTSVLRIDFDGAVVLPG